MVERGGGRRDEGVDGCVVLFLDVLVLDNLDVVIDIDMRREKTDSLHAFNTLKICR